MTFDRQRLPKIGGSPLGKAAGKSAKPRAVAGSAPALVRIVAGQWRQTPLPVITAPGLRPTPERVRQTLFNWLTHHFGSMAGLYCLDLFAGTGAHGFEAASRGAAHVQLNELNGAAAQSLRATQAKLQADQIQITQSDALTVLQGHHSHNRSFDVIFLDPPFHQALLEHSLKASAPLLKPGGLIYWEAENAPQPAYLLACQLQTWRQDHAGQVHFGLLQACDSKVNPNQDVK